jgi:hypothetical protein
MHHRSPETSALIAFAVVAAICFGVFALANAIENWSKNSRPSADFTICPLCEKSH